MNAKKEFRLFMILYFLVILFLIAGTRIARGQEYTSTCLYGEDTYLPQRKVVDSFYLSELKYIVDMLDTCEGVRIIPFSKTSYQERSEWIKRELIYLFSTNEYMVTGNIRVSIFKDEFLYYYIQ